MRDDAFIIDALQRRNRQRHVERFADSTGVAEVLFPRALPESGQLVLQPDLQVKGRQLRPGMLLPCQMQRYRAVDTTRNQGGDFHPLFFFVVI